MTEPIKIYKGKLSFDFIYADFEELPIEPRKCSSCHSFLDDCYDYIINNLEDKGLLHPSYKDLCCGCLNLSKLGLLHLRPLITSTYVEGDNIIFTVENPNGGNGIHLKFYDYTKLIYSDAEWL